VNNLNPAKKRPICITELKTPMAGRKRNGTNPNIMDFRQISKLAQNISIISLRPLLVISPDFSKAFW
jgi:hypothetical protein